MMHERIRAADEDFAEIGLTILCFRDADEGRVVKPYTDDGLTLFTMEEMQTSVSRTYEIWREIHEKRDHDSRGRATGTGPLI